MPKGVVEQVRLLEIVELFAPTDPGGHREHPVGQHGEEMLLGNQARHADDAKARARVQHLVQRVEAWNARALAHERVEAADEGRVRPVGQHLALALEERPPDRVILVRVGGPVLIDNIAAVPPAAVRRGVVRAIAQLLGRGLAVAGLLDRRHGWPPSRAAARCSAIPRSRAVARVRLASPSNMRMARRKFFAFLPPLRSLTIKLFLII